MAGVIIIASCRVHGFHLVKFRRGQLLKNIPAVQSEKHEQTKDRIHLCLYFTDNEKPTLCMPFFPPYYFTKTAAFSPPPPEHSPPQHCGVRSFFLSFFFPSLLLFCFHKFCTRHLCLLLLFSNFSCPFSFKSANKQKAKCLINAYVLYSPHLFSFWEIKFKKTHRTNTPHPKISILP